MADVNSNGIPDLIIANSNTNNVLILFDPANCRFAPSPLPCFSQVVDVGDTPLSLAVADVNHDEFLDLVTANNGSDDVSVLLRQSNGTFAPHQRSPFPVGREPRSVVAADFNADKIIDLATANGGTDNVSILLGQGDGSFLVEQGFGVGDNPSSLAVADINQDGAPDLVTANHFANTVSGLFGNGDGTFPAAQGFGVGALPRAVAVADLDRARQLNLVTANAGADHVSVLLGQGNGSFVMEQQVALSTELDTDAFGPHDVAIADLKNGDTILDLVTANAGVDENPSTTVSVLFGQGQGEFAAESFDLKMRQGAVAVGDLDGNHLPDLVTASIGTDDAPTNLIFVLRRRANGGFMFVPPAIQVATGPQDVELGDFNGDGRLDLVTANANAGNVSVVLGRGDGAFIQANRRDIFVGQRPVAVAVADLNGNAIFDLVTANADDHNVSILLGQGNAAFAPADPPEVPVGISPSDVAVANLAGGLAGGCAPGLYIITANASSNNVAVLQIQREASNVTLSAPQFFVVGRRPASVKVADFNGDGRPDLITANQDSDNVLVLLQRESEDGLCVFTP